MSDKMREAILQFGQDNPSLDLDFRLHTHGKYLTQEKAIVASRAFKAGAAWQAAQSVPVVGDVVAYTYQEEIEAGESSARAGRTGEIGVWHISKQPQCPDDALMLYLKPTHSISAADLERLRKDAERGRLLINRGEWLRFDHDTPDAHALLAVRLPYTANLSCKAMREDAIDAAIAAEGGK